MNNSYWDEYGLLHTQRGVMTENGVLFAAYYWMLNYKYDPLGYYDGFVGTSLRECLLSNVKVGFWFDPNPSDPNNSSHTHFSHDNMTGLYCLHYLHYRKPQSELRFIPILKWNHEWWLHPRDVVFYSIMKKRRWAYLLLPLLLIMSIISCIRDVSETSGKCLWWLRWSALELHQSRVVRKFAKYALSINELILRPKYGEHPWAQIFDYYFSNAGNYDNADHPIRVQWKKYVLDQKSVDMKRQK